MKEGVLKITLDTQCLIYLFDPDFDKPPHFESLTQLLNLSFSGKLNLAITTRAEVDLARDKSAIRKANMFEKLSIFPVVGSVATPINSLEGDRELNSQHAKLWTELRRIIFPGLNHNDKRIHNKISDIEHLIGHLINRRDVFVTNDHDILRNAKTLKDSVSLLVMAPDECLDHIRKESEHALRKFNRGPVLKYAADVMHIGGIGSRLTTKTAWLLTDHGYLNAEEFVIVGYNNGGDLMSLSAKPGYKIYNCASYTGNEILHEGSVSFRRIRLEDKMKNGFTIFCEAI
ncbi:MAG TPA: hypothetical protein VHE34_04795 [Puia sp.]|uniref:hypothetical protein n=1 Tax=Puia sp. TaxID=2045100 RepID=UPI002BBDFAD5|nr:hypothetical protein [Puia sp.]HVU94516.1 hypothetical protein [Puia sp.]